MEVLVRHEENRTLEEFVEGVPQNWWCEDTRDKEVLLLVKVQGSGSTHPYTHPICVRHCFSSKTVRLDSKSNTISSSNNSKKNQCQLEQRQPNNTPSDEKSSKTHSDSLKKS